MSEKRKPPKVYAIALSKAWGNRFPVGVRQIALEVSARQADSIAKIESLPFLLEDFEGALLRKSGGKRWGIAYSGHIREEGKVNFVIAHEFGHYLLHREQNGQTLCSEDDLRDFARASAGAANIEQEANEFASYLLMPIGDFRTQVNGHPVNLALLSHCANRYATSLAASTIKLIDFIDRPVVAILSKGGLILWARSSELAWKFGYCFKRGAAVPTGSVTFRCEQDGASMNARTGLLVDRRVWFDTASVLESAIAQPHYGTVFTLLECRDVAPPVRRPEEEENNITDAFDHFRSYSR